MATTRIGMILDVKQELSKLQSFRHSNGGIDGPTFCRRSFSLALVLRTSFCASQIVSLISSLLQFIHVNINAMLASTDGRRILTSKSAASP